MPDQLSEVIRAPEFAHGFRYGVIGAGLVLVLAALWRIGAGSRTSRAAPIAGLCVAGAWVLGLDRAGFLPPHLALAITVLGAGGLVVDLIPVVPPTLAFMLAAAPGAYLLADVAIP